MHSCPNVEAERLHSVDDRLAATHGTPLLAVSSSAVRRNFEALQAGLPGVEFYYAAKSNPNSTILRTLFELGCSVDVCSVGEMHAALDAGFVPSQMLHTHPCKTEANLMTCYHAGLRWFVYDNVNELRKVRRVAAKGAGRVTEVLLVIDATTGQNGLTQAKEFGAATDMDGDGSGLTGVVLTKLDGSANGGIVFAIETELGIPVKLVGLGEQIEDLVPFDPNQFVDALFSEN